jgi:quinol monooxygenase YgiN
VAKLPQTFNNFNVQFKERKMLRVLVTYKVKPDRVTENEELVKAVYDELRQNNDPDIHYATFKLDDGQTYTHIASFSSPQKQAELTESKSFQAFRENLPDRCEVPPNPQKLNEIDSYNFV